MAGDGIAVIEIKLLGWIEFNGAATVHFQMQSTVVADAIVLNVRILFTCPACALAPLPREVPPIVSPKAKGENDQLSC
jgi:hypothetical protein